MTLITNPPEAPMTPTEFDFERFMEAFQKGVLDAHNEHEINTEYDSLFWGNVDGCEFDSTEDAYTNGFEAVENTL